MKQNLKYVPGLLLKTFRELQDAEFSSPKDEVKVMRLKKKLEELEKLSRRYFADKYNIHS